MKEQVQKTGWEHFPHQADIGIRGFGQSKSQAFEQGALALTAVITEPKQIKPKEKIRITCQTGDQEILFVDWLNALLYEMDIRKMLFGKFEIRIEDDHLDAIAWGQKIDVAVHKPAVEVKGATYTALKVCKNENGIWVAQCVVDV